MGRLQQLTVEPRPSPPAQQAAPDPLRILVAWQELAAGVVPPLLQRHVEAPCAIFVSCEREQEGLWVCESCLANLAWAVLGCVQPGLLAFVPSRLSQIQHMPQAALLDG